MITRRTALVSAAAAALAVPAFALPGPLKPMKALFVNPGKSHEDFWVTTSRFMSAAAEALSIDLDIVYGERDRLMTVDLARERIAAATPGQYVLIVNEMRTGAPIYEAARQKGLKIFFTNITLSDEELVKYGAPRSVNADFLGALLPDNVAAGAELARRLIAATVAATGGPARIVAINGPSATLTSVERGQGLAGVLEHSRNAVLAQEVASDWTREDARARMASLILRYPDLNAVWAANDPMALGAIDALEQAGRHPGKDVVICGLNWMPEAVQAIHDGRLVCSAGGHFMIGGCALVMLRDFHQGIDFIDDGAIRVMPFGFIDRDNAEAWQNRFGGEDWARIDFKRVSRTFNPNWKGYDFSPRALLV